MTQELQLVCVVDEVHGRRRISVASNKEISKTIVIDMLKELCIHDGFRSEGLEKLFDSQHYAQSIKTARQQDFFITITPVKLDKILKM